MGSTQVTVRTTAQHGSRNTRATTCTPLSRKLHHTCFTSLSSLLCTNLPFARRYTHLHVNYHGVFYRATCSTMPTWLRGRNVLEQHLQTSFFFYIRLCCCRISDGVTAICCGMNFEPENTGFVVWYTLLWAVCRIR